MSDNDVTVENVEKELFKILDGRAQGGKRWREWRRRSYYLKALRGGRKKTRPSLAVV